MPTTRTKSWMPDQLPVLTRENIREEAGEILSALESSQPHQGEFQDNWRRLWQLIREAKAAFLPLEPSHDGPWHVNGVPGHVTQDASRSLSAGDFVVAIWPPDQAGLGADLPGFLNWAGVPVPHAR